MFKPATRHKLKARIGLEGPAGAGKTFTALRFAFALGLKVAVIDTEHGAASKYVGESPDQIPWKFLVCELEHFAPTSYVAAIGAAVDAGAQVIVIDSLSHAWEGVGGALDQVDRKKSSGNAFAAWKDVTPQHRRLVDAMLSCPVHLIATLRSKMGYELVKDERTGKMIPQKIGVKPIQREGMEYEFDVFADLDTEHLLRVSKTRCSALDGVTASKPGPDFVAPLIAWLDKGTEAAKTEVASQADSGGLTLDGKTEVDDFKQSEDDPCGDVVAGQIRDLAQRAGLAAARLREMVNRNGAERIADLPYRSAMKLKAKLVAKLDEEIPF